MPLSLPHHNRRRAIGLTICLIFLTALFWQASSEAGRKPAPGLLPLQTALQFSGLWEKRFDLKLGETFELSVGLPHPSSLPTNGRVAVRWTLVESKKEVPVTFEAASTNSDARKPDAFGIYTGPTANWKKTLHALDPDLYLVYRAPVAGTYQLEIAPVTDEAPVFEGGRWRDEGIAPMAVKFPRQTPWPAGKKVPLNLTLNPMNLNGSEQAGMHVEQEPNDTPEMAQVITLPEGEGVQAVRVSGGADDIEYFDNGRFGKSGDDWFQIVFNGKEPRLLTCNLAIPDHTLAAQLRFYSSTGTRYSTARPECRPAAPIAAAGRIHRRPQRERTHAPTE